MDDITEIYHELGLVKMRENDAANALQAPNQATFVLLPEIIDKMFITYSNINTMKHASHLYLTCSHREDIPVYIGNKNFISNRFPHLLYLKHVEAFDLRKSKTKLNVLNLIVIMCTSLDLSISMVCGILFFCFLNQEKNAIAQFFYCY